MGKRLSKVIGCILVGTGLFVMAGNSVKAEQNEVTIAGAFYSFDDQTSRYMVDEYDKTIAGTGSSDVYGEFALSGNISRGKMQDGFQTYEIGSGSVDFSYTPNDKYKNTEEETWHLVEDTSNEVNGVTLSDKIGKGAIIVQASSDGKRWVTEKSDSNIFDEEEGVVLSNYYTSQDIQQFNGTYFRIFVVYQMDMKVGDGFFEGIVGANTNHKKHAEVYSFYLVDSKNNSSMTVDPNAAPKKTLGTKAKTGLDNGYSNAEEVKEGDANYGWDIGNFYVNGYTREVYDSATGQPVFLKNANDQVVLWFNLKQDIDCLNGDENLKISEDINGHDQYFEVNKTNMGRGALFVRFTDHEGNATEFAPYLNFLEASTHTGANTRVQLFEEGNYEVALDYEIEKKDGLATYYENYRISFSFEVRNGDCMLFAKDLLEESFLQSGELTENGFYLDIAMSRYLNIDVQKSYLKKNKDGLYVEEVSVNQPAKDGDKYIDDGIYRFSVSNVYTGENTVKTYYVGDQDCYKALSRNGLSVNELNERLQNGWVIGEDGKLCEPEEVLTEKQEETVVENAEVAESEQIDEVEPTVESEETLKEPKRENAVVASNAPKIPSVNTKDVANIVGIVIICILLAGVLLVVILLLVKKNKRKNKEVESINESTNEENK